MEPYVTLMILNKTLTVGKICLVLGEKLGKHGDGC